MTRTAFVGTYTEGDSDGIYHLEVSGGDDPALDRTGVTAVEDNPSFLAAHPTEPVRYAVHEVAGGGATAFRVESDGSETELTNLGRVESGADGPCHCSVHPAGDHLLVAHYTGAAVSVLPVDADGALGDPTHVVERAGSSEHPERQTQAHPHSVTPGPDGRYVYVPDLGTDEVVVYALDADAGRLNRAGSVDARSGAGPRHLDFGPDGRFAYVINELDSTLTAYERDPGTGALDPIDTASTLPDGFDGDNVTADVHVHPSGEWVYGSNRGHDSVAVFGIESDGTLDPRGTVPTGGAWPRNFALAPDGRALFAENMHSDEVVAFRVDERTGDLEPAGAAVDVPDPCCLVLTGDAP
ncbi:MAG: lactonase family protein [Haloarculaceae archaeon]